MKRYTVRKCAPDGTLLLAYDAWLAERSASAVLLDARWERPTLDLGYTTFETGDHFAERYFADRWYNILEIRGTTSGALKGWYCNVTAPAIIEDASVTYRDLYLDVWVDPQGGARILDEDEFDAAPLDDETRRHARDGLRLLLAAIARRQPPFDAIAGQ